MSLNFNHKNHRPYFYAPLVLWAMLAHGFAACAQEAEAFTAIVNIIGENLGNLTKIGWETRFEKRTAVFVVERSEDAQHFTELTRVAGGGTGRDNRTYSVLDMHAPDESGFYRVKAIDSSGHFLFSGIIEVRNIKLPRFTVTPQVLEQQISLTGTIRMNTCRVTLYDGLGNRIFPARTLAVQDEITIDMQRFSHGLYNVVIYDGQRNYRIDFAWLPL